MSTFGKAKVGIGGATFALDLGATNTFNWGCLFDLTKNQTKQTWNSGVFQRDWKTDVDSEKNPEESRKRAFFVFIFLGAEFRSPPKG